MFCLSTNSSKVSFLNQAQKFLVVSCSASHSVWSQKSGKRAGTVIEFTGDYKSVNTENLRGKAIRALKIL